MKSENLRNPSATSAGSNWAGLLQWLVLSVLGLTIFTLMAAHAPGRIKLIGPFAVGFGLAAGAGLVALARIIGARRRRFIVWWVPVFIAAGQIGMAIESHRLYAKQVRRDSAGDVNVLKLARFLHEGAAPEDPDQKAQYEQMQQSVQKAAEERRRELQEKTSFTGYLRHRLSPLGSWPRPWPTVFWLGEVLLGTAAGIWLVIRMTRGMEEGESPADIQSAQQEPGPADPRRY